MYFDRVYSTKSIMIKIGLGNHVLANKCVIYFYYIYKFQIIMHFFVLRHAALFKICVFMF